MTRWPLPEPMKRALALAHEAAEAGEVPIGAVVVKGGVVIGPHLSLLGNYLLGYEVSWEGAVLGFFEAGAVGNRSEITLGHQAAAAVRRAPPRLLGPALVKVTSSTAPIGAGVST